MRPYLSAGMICLIVLGLQSACQPLPTAPSISGSLFSIPAMSIARAAHTSTLLPNGQVLVVGGFHSDDGSETPVASAELYDPQRQRFVPTGALNEARVSHTATLLNNGQVLIVGGWTAGRRTATAELYDPASGEFTYTSSLQSPRAGMTATRLNDGRVLIAGGERQRNRHQPVAEIYDPAIEKFSPGAALNTPRSAHTATLLDDGRVLLVGGSINYETVLASAELYDPQMDVFITTGSLTTARHKHAAVQLRNGSIMVVGGSDAGDWDGQLASSEIYDVVSETFVPGSPLSAARFKLADAVIPLSNGDIFIGGGARQLERYMARSQKFTLAGTLDEPYHYATTTLLQDGGVLIIGGYNQQIEAADQAWLYQP